MSKKKKGSIPTTQAKKKSNSCGKITVAQQLAMLRGQRRLEEIASSHNAASGTGAHKNKATDKTSQRREARKQEKRLRGGDDDAGP